MTKNLCSMHIALGSINIPPPPPPQREQNSWGLLDVPFPSALQVLGFIPGTAKDRDRQDNRYGKES